MRSPLVYDVRWKLKRFVAKKGGAKTSTQGAGPPTVTSSTIQKNNAGHEATDYRAVDVNAGGLAEERDPKAEEEIEAKAEASTWHWLKRKFFKK